MSKNHLTIIHLGVDVAKLTLQLDPTHLGGSYVALSVCIIDTASGDVDCAWAGIEPPFVLPEGGEPLPLLDCGGPLLGVMQASEFHAQRVTLRPGSNVDALVPSIICLAASS